MTEANYRGRFAPTPSGEMHVGNARTALIAWLDARSRGGTFVLRMEDIDGPRCKPHFYDLILEDLRWLGIDWDEGPDVGGPYGPYVQSLRLADYDEALKRLEARGLLYPCYCSRAELLAVASAPHGLASEGPAYPGTCRHLTDEERRERERKKSPSLRFRLPDRAVAFEDGAAGPQRFAPGAGGDFVVRRADGIVSYQLAVVVDDAAMAITDVVRGADLLDSTPRQLFLFEALGLNAPRYAHVPLLCGPDGKRLAKRHGALSIRALRERGVRPEQVVGAIAAVSGLHDRPEPIAARELIAGFRLEKVPKEPVVVDEAWIAGLTGG
ncbi:MAG: tRNA glutamyl-Q synthetase [Thermobacillus sp. ZCTH02-B1]|uniref:tRNA glutamyl-Q(34) synthetase GluQRS n=1 Tax=Thermobacillus sp. ZCTH02-B1 TaxID=1858795 RepID=UPI000B57AB2D|nr:tRNA glutamyl-Q(34) synthetase GluQRS [Thermobacillus sp. ZCTH02-B1]OUM96579.1 MAG: tRNA glutamyl-Q synthetase [Thermobacillus sp. ZCTH02-B1]